MIVSTITSKGQLTVPSAVRKQLKLRTGDRVSFGLSAGGTEAVMRPVSRSLDEVFGRLKNPGHAAVSVAGMNKAVAQRMRGEHP